MHHYGDSLDFWNHSSSYFLYESFNDGVFCLLLVFFFVIRPEKRGKCKLLEHELVHCRQFYCSLGTYPLIYLISRRYRYKSEIEAYKEQIRLGGATIEEAANRIIRNYGITGLSMGEVKSDLQQN